MKATKTANVQRAAKHELSLLSRAARVPPSILGRWVNELGSVMTITSLNNGAFKGKYESKVSGLNKPVTGKLQGAIAGDTLGFVVNWSPAVQSTTCWSGKLLFDARTKRPHLFTLWHLSRALKNKKDNLWLSIIAGSDMFWKE